MSANRENAAASGAPLIASGKDALLSLADKCEQATGPDRELDEAILKAAWAVRSRRSDLGPAFTASLDAAMMLVPEPAWVRMDQWPLDFCHGPVASVQPIREPQVASHVGTGSTLALALCAAALRSRSTGGDGDE